MNDLKPVVFRIILDLADAQKQIDDLLKGLSKGSPDGKGVPQAPKPVPGTGGRIPGEAPGTRFAPGRGGGIVPGAPGASAGGGGAAFAMGLGAINRAVLNPGGFASGAAASGVGAALGTAGAAVGIVAGSALFVEQVIPILLAALEKYLPDIPFFAEWRKEFDKVSDWITDKRAALEAIVTATAESLNIAAGALKSGGVLTAENTTDLFENLRDINRETRKWELDIAKEERKAMGIQAIESLSRTALLKSLAEGLR